MIRRYITPDGRILRAMDRARALRHYARRVTAGHYRVKSESDKQTTYNVYITPRGLVCDCKAGYYGRPCKHAARVAMRLERERIGY